MEFNYIPTPDLTKILQEKVFPSYTDEQLGSMSFQYREKNWTCMGSYIYAHYSKFTKSQQDTIRENVKMDLMDKWSNVEPQYLDLLTQQVLEIEDFSDVEEGSEEYYELLDDYINDTAYLNDPFLHFQLMCIDLLEDYFSKLEQEGQSILQDQVDEVVKELGLNDEYDYIYGDDDEEGVGYCFDFNYDDLRYDLWVDNEKMTMDELKEFLQKKFDSDLVVS